MVITLGQQYNVGEKPTVILYTYIAMQGHQQKGKQNNASSNNKDKYNTIIEQRTMMRIFIIQVHDPVIHLEATTHRCSSCMDLAMVPR